MQSGGTVMSTHLCTLGACFDGALNQLHVYFARNEGNVSPAAYYIAIAAS